MEHKHSFCKENPMDCSFTMKCYPAGAILHKEDLETHSIVFCHTGHLRISCRLFHDEILCAGEIMLIPRQSECTGVALSDTTLLVHRFNNTVCNPEKCILAHLYSHRSLQSKSYCCKLEVCYSFRVLMENIIFHITDKKYDTELWKMKHKELIWGFTHYYSTEELHAFFHPMTGEQVPFKSLVITYYRKAEYTDKLAEMCGYPLHTFRRKFKEEFGVSAHRWLTIKRAEIVRHRLSLDYIPFSDIIAEFRFSSPQQFNRFCKDNLGDSPLNLRQKYTEEANKANLSKNDN